MVIDNCGNRDSNKVINEKLCRCKELGFERVAISVIMESPKNDQFEIPPAPKMNELTIPSQMTVYTRLTAKVSEAIQIYKIIKSKERSNYQLLALEPQNMKILQYLAMGTTNFEILTFDLAERLDYNLFKIKLKCLEDKGVCIEINYGPAQLGSSLRRNTITNGQSIVEKGTKNIIVSSGVDDIFRLRGPKDAKYLCVLFMLPINKCHPAVYTNGLKAINLAEHHRNPASSAIKVEIQR